MQDKGAVNVSTGNARILAGVHLTYGLDTLIPSSNISVYDELLELRRGDRIRFSGSFVVHKNSLVEMSYTGSSSISTPEFLFNFSSIHRLKP